MWVEFNNNLISKITEFIACLVKKKDDWTKTPDTHKVLHHTFVALTKTSPKVFLGDWEKNGDLHPSSIAFLWATAIRVLGCAFNLRVQFRMTAKGILKNDVKDLKFREKKLTFDPGCVPTKTKQATF